MKRILLFLTCVLTLFGVSRAETKTVKWEAKDSYQNSSTTLTTANWTLNRTEGTSNTPYNGYDGTKGMQIGSGSNYVRTVTISSTTSSVFNGKTITSVKVNASTASSATATLKVEVGSSSYGSKSLTTSATDYDLTGNSTGIITITISQPSTQKALYLKSIEVTYEEGNSDTPPTSISFEPNGGSIDTKTEISLTANGSPTPTIEYQIDGQGDYVTYSTPITLNAGTHTIYAKATNDSGSTSAQATFNVSEYIAPSTLTATVIMNDQDDLSYGKDKEIIWVSTEDKDIEFSTIATITGSTYPTKSSGNLRIYNSNGNTITVNAPKGYYFVSVKAKLGTAANHIAIDGTEIKSDNGIHTFTNAQTSSFELTSVKSNDNKNSDVTSLTFELESVENPGLTVASPVISCENNKVTITCSTDNAEIYYTLDGQTPDLTSTKYDGKPFAISSTTTVKAIAYVDGTASKVAEYKAYYLPEQPMKVVEALALINDGYEGELTAKGIVNRTTSFNSNFGSITYYISDDGTTTDELQVYGGLNIGGTKFNAQSDIEAGATVVVMGNVKIYNNVPEFDANNELLEYTAPIKQVATPIILFNGKAVEEGDEIELGSTITITSETSGALFTGYIEFEDEELVPFEDEEMPFEVTFDNEGMLGLVSISGYADKEGMTVSESIDDFMFYVVKPTEKAPSFVTITPEGGVIDADTEITIVADGTDVEITYSINDKYYTQPYNGPFTLEDYIKSYGHGTYELNVKAENSLGSKTNSASYEVKSKLTVSQGDETLISGEEESVTITVSDDYAKEIVIRTYGIDGISYTENTFTGTEAQFEVNKLNRRFDVISQYGSTNSTETKELFYNFGTVTPGSTIYKRVNSADELGVGDRFVIAAISSGVHGFMTDQNGSNKQFNYAESDLLKEDDKDNTNLTLNEIPEGTMFIKLEEGFKEGCYYLLIDDKNANSYLEVVSTTNSITKNENGVDVTISFGTDGYIKIQNGTRYIMLNKEDTANGFRSYQGNGTPIIVFKESLTDPVIEMQNPAYKVAFASVGEAEIEAVAEGTEMDVESQDGNIVTYTTHVSNLAGEFSFNVEDSEMKGHNINDSLTAGKEYTLLNSNHEKATALAFDQAVRNATVNVTLDPFKSIKMSVGTWYFTADNLDINEDGTVVVYKVDENSLNENSTLGVKTYSLKVDHHFDFDKILYSVNSTSAGNGMGVKAFADDTFTELESNGTADIPVDNENEEDNVKFGKGTITLKYVKADGTESAPATYNYYVTTSTSSEIPTAVGAIGAEAGEAQYFTIDGVKVENPDKGIYIKVEGGKAVKVIR